MFIRKTSYFAKKDLFILLLYILSVLLFFHKLLVHPDWVLFGTDFMDQYASTKSIRDTVLNQKQYPLWITDHFSGMPHIDATHTLHLNIFCMLYYILPLPLAFTLFFSIHFLFAGFFTYIFSRESGVSRPGSFLSGLIFMYSGILTSHIFVGHIGKIASWSYIPLLLFLVSRGINRRRTLYFLTAGIVMGHQFLGGHMQMGYYSTLFVGTFAVFKIIDRRKKEDDYKKWLLRPGALFLLTLVIAVLLYSLQLLPSYLYTQKYSERSGGTTYEFSTSWSFAPQELPGIFIRDPFGFAWPGTDKNFKKGEIKGEFSEPFVPYWGPMPQRLAGEYFGVLPLILALIGIVFRRDRYSWFFTGTAAFTLLLSMGKYTPFYWLAYKFVYGFSFFRVPLSIFALTAFALSILAGRGVEFILSEKSDKEEKGTKKLVLYDGRNFFTAE